MSFLLAFLRVLASAFSLGVASVALLAFLGFAIPALDLLNHLQALIFPAAIVGLLAAAILRPGPWRGFVMAFAATGFIASATAYVPDLTRSFLPRDPLPTDGRPVLRLMTHNVFGLNFKMGRVADVIAEVDPDIVAIQEYFPAQRSQLPPLLAERYPHTAYCVGGKRANIALYAKIPFDLVQTGVCSEHAAASQRTSQIRATFTLEDGTVFTVLTTHLDWPFPIERQQHQLLELADAVNEISGPLIVVGDMNSTSWSYAMRAFAAAAGLIQQDHNLVTYPLKFTLPRLTDDPQGLFPLFPFLPLDHVFTRGPVRIHALDTGPDTNSDHLPVVFTFSVDPATDCCAPD